MKLWTGKVTIRCAVARCRNTFEYPRAMEARRVAELCQRYGWAQGRDRRYFDFYCPAHARLAG